MAVKTGKFHGLLQSQAFYQTDQRTPLRAIADNNQANAPGGRKPDNFRHHFDKHMRPFAKGQAHNGNQRQVIAWSRKKRSAPGGFPYGIGQHMHLIHSSGFTHDPGGARAYGGEKNRPSRPAKKTIQKKKKGMVIMQHRMASYHRGNLLFFCHIHTAIGQRR